MTTPEVYPIYFLKKRKLQQDPEDAQAFQYLRALGRMGYMAGPGLAALGGQVSMAELNHLASSMPPVPMSMMSQHPLDSMSIPRHHQHPSEPNSARHSVDA